VFLAQPSDTGHQRVYTGHKRAEKKEGGSRTQSGGEYEKKFSKNRKKRQGGGGGTNPDEKETERVSGNIFCQKEKKTREINKG